MTFRASMAFELSRGTRKFVDCCSVTRFLHDFLIVSINENVNLIEPNKKIDFAVFGV